MFASGKPRRRDRGGIKSWWREIRRVGDESNQGSKVNWWWGKSKFCLAATKIGGKTSRACCSRPWLWWDRGGEVEETVEESKGENYQLPTKDSNSSEDRSAAKKEMSEHEGNSGQAQKARFAAYIFFLFLCFLSLHAEVLDFLEFPFKLSHSGQKQKWKWVSSKITEYCGLARIKNIIARSLNLKFLRMNLPGSKNYLSKNFNKIFIDVGRHNG